MQPHAKLLETSCCAYIHVLSQSKFTSGQAKSFVGAYRVPSTVDHDWKFMQILQNLKEHDLKMLFSLAPCFQTFRQMREKIRDFKETHSC